MPTLSFIVGGLALAGLALLGAYFVKRSLGNLELARYCRAWPSVTGGVLDSALDAGLDAESSTKADVRYAYEVDGRRYESRRVYFGDGLGEAWGASKTKRIVARYPPRQQVRVFYDPFDPQRAVLEPGVNAEILIDLLTGLTLLALALALPLTVLLAEVGGWG